MNHPKRRWTVKTVLNAFQLVSKVKPQAGPPCKGFKLQRYLFLPDDELGREDKGTFVVVKEPVVPDGLFREVWQGVFPHGSPETVADLIRAIVKGEMDNSEGAMDIESPPTFDVPQAHQQCVPTHCVLESPVN